MTFSIDNLVVTGIVLLMLLVIAFSIGTERGKYLARWRERKLAVVTLSSLENPSPALIQRTGTVPVLPGTQPRVVLSEAANGKTQGLVRPSIAPGQPGVRTVRPVSAMGSSRPLPATRALPQPRTIQPLPVMSNPTVIRKPMMPPQPVIVPKSVNVPQPVVSQKPVMVQARLSLPAVPGMISENSSNKTNSRSPSGNRGVDPRAMTPASGLASAAGAAFEKKIDNAYTIQVASYATADLAQQAAQNLRQKGMEVSVLPKGKFAILCVGRFLNKADAQKGAQRMKKQFKDCLIRSL